LAVAHGSTVLQQLQDALDQQVAPVERSLQSKKE
jgi:hypothetical protein